jgi:hypothetical protein
MKAFLCLNWYTMRTRFCEILSLNKGVETRTKGAHTKHLLLSVL